ncbi:MAG: hypothetical protein EAZ92_15455 [Candidatus Kapaibacterium sp.]|nr:MAG: hypothetical protein EAZ92_15455 [Candidatus Kapabacteria bacterium]
MNLRYFFAGIRKFFANFSQHFLHRTLPPYTSVVHFRLRHSLFVHRLFTMKKTLFIIFLVMLALRPLSAQIPEADSLKQRLTMLQQRHSSLDTAVISCLNAIAYSMRNNHHDSALIYAREAYRRAEQIQFLHGKAKSLLTQGIVAIYEGHYNAALDLHLQSFDLFVSLKDSVQQGYVLNNIGYLYKAQGKYTIAKDYFLRAEALFRQCNFVSGLALVYGNLGDIALKVSSLQEALEMERKAFALTQHSKESYLASVALYHIGTIFFTMQRYDSALSYQHRALQLFLTDGNKSYAIRSFDNLAAIYAARGQYTEAFGFAERGHTLADSFNVSLDLVLMKERLSALHERTGNPTQALRYFRETTSLRDSLSVQNIEQRMKVLDMMRSSEQTQKELLWRESEQKHLEWVQKSLIAAIFLSSTLLLLVVHRYRYVAKAERELRTYHDVVMQQQRQLQESHTGLEQANKRLAGLNYEKDELLGIVAHDLKNPLTAIILASSGLGREAERSPNVPSARVHTLTQRIGLSSERMMNIITKLLRSNVLEEKGVELRLQMFDITALVRSITDEHVPHALSKGIALHVESPPTPLYAYADANASAEVFENLLDNALKYSPHGKKVYVRLKSHCSSSATINPDNPDNPDTHAAPAKNQHRNTIRLEVQDEGPGLSAEDMKKLFGKFARLSAQPTDGEQSIGLGLNIVKKLVESMQGRVWCESKQAKESSEELPTGATFFVELPARQE